jgi:hypothetical protein
MQTGQIRQTSSILQKHPSSFPKSTCNPRIGPHQGAGWLVLGQRPGRVVARRAWVPRLAYRTSEPGRPSNVAEGRHGRRAVGWSRL